MSNAKNKLIRKLGIKKSIAISFSLGIILGGAIAGDPSVIVMGALFSIVFVLVKFEE